MNAPSPQTIEESHHQQFADQDYIPGPWPKKIVVDFRKVLDPLDVFFRTVFGEGVGYGALSYGRIPNTPIFFKWPEQKDEMLAEAARQNRKTNVFFCPALR